MPRRSKREKPPEVVQEFTDSSWADYMPHIATDLYVIRYEWPNGKVRYRTEGPLCVDIQDAGLYTLVEATKHVRNSRDARIVWDIQTRKEKQ